MDFLSGLESANDSAISFLFLKTQNPFTIRTCTFKPLEKKKNLWILENENLKSEKLQNLKLQILNLSLGNL